MLPSAVLAVLGVAVVVLLLVGPLRPRRRRGLRQLGPVEPPVDPPAPPPAVPADQEALALQGELTALVRRTNAAGGRLPVGAVPAVRSVEDVLRPLLGHVQRQGASAEELHQLRSIVSELLPGAVDAYLALPEHYAATTRGAEGRTPGDELVSQLGLLHEGAEQLARAVYDSDAQQLAIGRRFLDSKFRPLGPGPVSGTPPVQLARGANTPLTLSGGDAGAVVVGMGWRLPAAGSALEVDALLVLLDERGRATGEDDVIFFSQVAAAAPGSTRPGAPGAVTDDDDAEQVVLDLAAVPARVTRILVGAAIFAAAARRQTFAQVAGAYVRLADAGTGGEICRHELQAGTGTETVMVFGELYRHVRQWKFRAVGQGYTGGLADVARDVGLPG